MKASRMNSSRSQKMTAMISQEHFLIQTGKAGLQKKVDRQKSLVEQQYQFFRMFISHSFV